MVTYSTQQKDISEGIKKASNLFDYFLFHALLSSVDTDIASHYHKHGAPLDCGTAQKC